MVEVTNGNFNSIVCDFEHDIKKCSFYSIDCEFTSLPSSFGYTNSFLDSPEDRYRGLKEHIKKCVIIQCGITPFRYNRDLNNYKGSPYNFYIFPREFGSFNTTINYSLSAISFLCNSHFNFDRVFYGGIHYINRTDWNIAFQQLREGTLMNNIEENLDYLEIDNIVEICDSVKRWISTSTDNSLELSCREYNPAFNYALTEEIRRLNKQVWTTNEDNKIIVTRVNPEERAKLEQKEQTLEVQNAFMESIKGFSKIFDILIASKKPLIGHNNFLDLLTMYNQFYEDLPDSYNKFKKNLNSLFPKIYDTKFIALELNHFKNKDKVSTSLEKLYVSYQDSQTNFYFPQVLMEPKGIYEIEICLAQTESRARQIKPLLDFDAQRSHDAGWDSYMTGFIFLKMADEFIRAKKKEQHFVHIMPTELFSQIECWTNKIRIVRCAVTHLNLAGDEPVSRRPPLLHVSHFKKQRLRPVELDSIFKKYEPINKKWINNNYSALIATPNRASFNRILLDFNNSAVLKVEKYSLIKHNRKAQVILLSGLCIPVVLTLWLGLKK